MTRFTMPSAAGLRIGRHPSRPERWAVLDSDGNARTWFAIDSTFEEAGAALAQGLALLAASGQHTAQNGKAAPKE